MTLCEGAGPVFLSSTTKRDVGGTSVHGNTIDVHASKRLQPILAGMEFGD